MLTTFEIYRRAEKCFEKCLPPDWIPTKPRDDIGVDYWVQITKQGSPTPLSFFVQVKGTADPRRSGIYSFSVPAEKLKQYMETPLPVVICACLLPRTKSRIWLTIAGFARQLGTAFFQCVITRIHHSSRRRFLCQYPWHSPSPWRY